MTRHLPYLLSAFFACAASATTPSATRAVIPLHFEANRGQTDPRVQFIARAGEHAVYLGRAEAFITLDDSSNSTRVVRLSFPGANPDAVGVGIEKSPGRVNYLIGNDPAEWHTGIPTYRRVEYSQLYPGVDLVFHGRQQKLEYDFVVAPGANAGAITIQFEGSERIQLDAQGDLIIRAGSQQFRQHAPKAWQKTAGLPVPVSVAYSIKNSRTVTFALGAYDRSRELIIDPMISYSTFIGGSERDRAWAVAVDGSGNAYVAGDTKSTLKNLPLSGVQTKRGSSNGDGFVAKLNADGTDFDYLTFLGGKDIDAAVAIAVDSANNAYVAGYTTSPNFPITTGAFQKKIKSSVVKGGYTVFRADAFVSKLNPAGDTLIYSTFYGGKKDEGALGLAVDSNGNALICGFSNSSDLPTNNAAQPKFGGGTDAFLAKFNADASALIFATYIGLSGLEHANGVAVNGAGEAYVVGWTDAADVSSTNPFPSTAIYGDGGGRDVFLRRHSPTGERLSITFFGGSGSDMGYSVTIDAQSNVYVSGSKASSVFPTTTGINRGGIFTSTDSADSWLPASGQLFYNSIQAFAPISSNPLQILAGTPLGLFDSSDGGGVWRFNHSLSAKQRNISAIAVNPGIPTNWFVGTSRTVLQTTNAGLTWTTNAAGLSSGNIRALVFQPGLSSTLYAGSYGGGVYVSTNAATNWSRIKSGLGNLFVNGLVVDPLAPSTLYAATDGGVYKSTNSGTKWFSRSTGLSPSKHTQALILDPSSPTTLYAGTTRGLFKSTNGADTWALIGAGIIASNVTALALDSSNSNLYVGTTNGVFRSTDAGASFTTNSTGLNTPAVGALAAPPGRLYAGLRGTNGFGGTNDAFLIKLTPDASTILYSVILGGSKGDEGFSAAVAADGSVAFAGATASSNFPVVDAPSTNQEVRVGKSDAWVAYIDPTGSSLVYSFYLGGKENDYAESVALDSDDNVYVAGYTSSSDFPTVSPVQEKRAGGSDAFLAKITAAGQSLLVETVSDYIVARWPASSSRYQLETAETADGSWQRVNEAPAIRGKWNIVVVPTESVGRFFRLKAP